MGKVVVVSGKINGKNGNSIGEKWVSSTLKPCVQQLLSDCRHSINVMKHEAVNVFRKVSDFTSRSIRVFPRIPVS